jgi:hypothetical protein
VLFYERNKDLVRERTWLAKGRGGTDEDDFFSDVVIQCDLLRATRCALGSWQNNAPATRSSVFSI